MKTTTCFFKHERSWKIPRNFLELRF